MMMAWCKVILFIVVLMSTLGGNAQLPSTSIYTLQMRANEEKVLLDQPQLLTGFNANGYNNQPSFVDRNKLMITSDYKALGLTDIYELNLADYEVTRVTATEESEYSPTVMPDGINFSVVRQELDDSETVPQILWAYPLDKSTSGAISIDLDNIGYHCWLSDHQVALFLVATPSELVIYNTQTKTTSHVAYDVGRCLKTDKKGALHYVHKIASSWNIRKYNLILERSSLVARAIVDQEDFDILPNGYLLSAKGSVLHTYRPSVDREWQPLLDLKGAGITKISRIASTSDKIAIVSAH